jgi:hypothetical protein
MMLWKAVREDGTDFFTGRLSYLKTAEAPDFKGSQEIECGNGLHLGDSPSAARYFVPSGEKFRLFQVSVLTSDCVCYPGTPRYPMKLRAKKCTFVREYPADYEEPFEDGY